MFFNKNLCFISFSNLRIGELKSAKKLQLNKFNGFFSINNSHTICRTPSSRENVGDTGFKSHFHGAILQAPHVQSTIYSATKKSTDCKDTTIKSSKNHAIFNSKIKNQPENLNKIHHFFWGYLDRPLRSKHSGSHGTCRT